AGGEKIARPDRYQAADHRQHDVAAGAEPLPVLHEAERLDAERGERRIAAADADGDELPRGRPRVDPAVRPGRGGEESDDERAEDVDDQGAPRKGLADKPRRHARAPVARNPTERAADGDPEVACHAIPFPLTTRAGARPRNAETTGWRWECRG